MKVLTFIFQLELRDVSRTATLLGSFVTRLSMDEASAELSHQLALLYDSIAFASLYAAFCPHVCWNMSTFHMY